MVIFFKKNSPNGSLKLVNNLLVLIDRRLRYGIVCLKTCFSTLTVWTITTDQLRRFNFFFASQCQHKELLLQICSPESFYEFYLLSVSTNTHSITNSYKATVNIHCSFSPRNCNNLKVALIGIIKQVQQTWVFI